jgi:hypothetical protein
MRRRTLLAALAGLAVLVAAGVVVLWPRSSSRITRENFDRIKVGMSLAEVETILGAPGDYTTGPYDEFSPDLYSGGDLDWARATKVDWWSDTSGVTVVFDVSGSVQGSFFDRCHRAEQGPLANLLWRAKRQWHGHRWFPE